jgi:hypothetical protein
LHFRTLEGLGAEGDLALLGEIREKIGDALLANTQRLCKAR